VANAFHKYLTGEDKLQHNVILYLQMQHPSALWTHVPNEGRRTPFERFKLKYLGVKSGVPDILIFTPNKKYNGLAIELKYKKNKPTENQKIWLNQLNQNGWKSECINDLQQCIDLIDQYFNNEI
jgi:hypothetical protein